VASGPQVQQVCPADAELPRGGARLGEIKGDLVPAALGHARERARKRGALQGGLVDERVIRGHSIGHGRGGRVRAHARREVGGPAVGPREALAARSIRIVTSGPRASRRPSQSSGMRQGRHARRGGQQARCGRTRLSV